MSKQSNWIGWEPTNIPLNQEHPFILVNLNHGPCSDMPSYYKSQRHKVRKFLGVSMNPVWKPKHCALFAFMLQASEIVSCWPSSALAVTSRENLKTGSNPRQHPSKDANWLQSRNPGNIRPKISNWMKTGSHSKIRTTSGVLECRDFVSFACGWNWMNNLVNLGRWDVAKSQWRCFETAMEKGVVELTRWKVKVLVSTMTRRGWNVPSMIYDRRNNINNNMYNEE